MIKEEKFFDALKDLFLGAKIDRESGYIKLMKIKAGYYEKGVFPKLREDIEETLKPFPEFREELFDKLLLFLVGIFLRVVRFILGLPHFIKMFTKGLIQMPKTLSFFGKF